MEGFAMIETIIKQFAGATNKDIEKAFYPATSKGDLGIHLMRGLRRL